MKKNTYLFIFLFLYIIVCAQQTPQFTQFTFNKSGYNPASAGSNINSGFEAITGLRKQWIGNFQGPATNFLSANYTIKPERSYRYWQNIGFYTTTDKSGIFQNFSAYLSYAIHVPLNNKWIGSIGLFAGARRFSIAKGFISEFDPVYARTAESLWTYPDFIPGIRIYNRKFFFDLSVQQLYKNRVQQNGKQIGTQSILHPQIYLSVGKRIYFENKFILVPTANIHGSISSIPSIEMNLMAYYRSRIGFGASLRAGNFISGIFQVRFFKNATAGFSYDYSLNNYGSAYSHSVEFMIGITPFMSSLESAKTRRNIVKCPALDF
jgi:type IX secretion system PorP/SprF family membrane protein